MKEFYTIKELADRYSVSTRTIERHLKNLIIKEKNKTLIPKDVVNLLELRHKYDTTPTQNKQQENTEVDYDIIEGFSTEEYQEFQKRLIEYPVLKQELEYHKKSAESHQRQMEKILTIMQERNLLEASNNPKFKNLG